MALPPEALLALGPHTTLSISSSSGCSLPGFSPVAEWLECAVKPEVAVAVVSALRRVRRVSRRMKARYRAKPPVVGGTEGLAGCVEEVAAGGASGGALKSTISAHVQWEAQR